VLVLLLVLIQLADPEMIVGLAVKSLSNDPGETPTLAP
jgi:hypothetical protein